MLEKLNALWKSATAPQVRHDYIVYAPNKDTYAGFKVDQEYSSRRIHKTIAYRENNNATRQSPGIIQPGSFNFVRVQDCADLEQAVKKAKTKGLKYESMKVTLAKHLNAAKEQENRNGLDDGVAEIEALFKKISGMDLKEP